MTQALRGAAFDLAFDQRGIDGAAHIVSGGDLQDLHRAEFRIDGNLGQVRAKSEYGVGNSLTVFVERAGRRIEGGFRREHVAVWIQRKRAQIDGALPAFVSCFGAAMAEL